TPLRKVGAVLTRGLRGSSRKRLWKCTGHVGRAPRVWSLLQALGARHGKALHWYRGRGRRRVDMAAGNDLADSLRTAHAAGLLGLLEHSRSSHQRIIMQVACEGAPQARDTPPRDDDDALGTRPCAPPGRPVPWHTHHETIHRREAHGREPRQYLRVRGTGQGEAGPGGV